MTQDQINYIVSERVVSHRNKDWGRKRAINDYLRKCMPTVEEKRHIDELVQDELNCYRS